MKKSIFKMGTAMAFGLVMMCACGGTTNENSDGGAPTDSVQPAVEVKEAESNWEYSEYPDEMSDDTTYLASVVSENSVDFDFPYDGGSTLTLTVRKSPQYGSDIYIKISKGQFNSGIYGQKIKVRFDESKAFDVNCRTASDGSSDLLFLTNYKKLVKQLKDAKVLKVSCEFWNEGTRTFTFNVEGLKWEHGEGKK